MQKICVIDNSTLINLTRLHHLKIFRDLRGLFKAIYVPAKVLEEYEDGLFHEPERKVIIDQIKLANLTFLSFCNYHDTITLNILKTTPGIDPGEAEAAAQHKRLGSQLILSDDQEFIDAIRIADKHVRVWSTLHVIAMLDFSKVSTHPPATLVKELYQHHPFTRTTLRTAYSEIIAYLGIHVPSNQLSKRLSFKKLGLA